LLSGTGLPKKQNSYSRYFSLWLQSVYGVYVDGKASRPVHHLCMDVHVGMSVCRYLILVVGTSRDVCTVLSSETSRKKELGSWLCRLRRKLQRKLQRCRERVVRARYCARIAPFSRLTHAHKGELLWLANYIALCFHCHSLVQSKSCTRSRSPPLYKGQRAKGKGQNWKESKWDRISAKISYRLDYHPPSPMPPAT
jgi:hypothetical protein